MNTTTENNVDPELEKWKELKKELVDLLQQRIELEKGMIDVINRELEITKQIEELGGY